MALAVTTFSLGILAYEYEFRPGNFVEDGRYDVALIIREYSDKNFTIAATEAGLLPLYSGWRAVETWGLNDQWIAHNGSVTKQYLDRFQPEVIVFHALCSPLVPLPSTNIDEGLR